MSDADRAERFEKVGEVLSSVLGAVERWGLDTRLAHSGVLWVAKTLSTARLLAS